MTVQGYNVWLIILVLGAGTYLIRLSFLGLIGGRDLPPWVLRYLRYTPVAVMPGLIAPMILWPQATGGQLDAPRLAAATVALVLGWRTKNILVSVLGGMITLYAVQSLI